MAASSPALRSSLRHSKRTGAHAILIEALGESHDRTIGAIQQLADLYDAWHAAEPDSGHDASATTWREKLPADEDGG